MMARPDSWPRDSAAGILRSADLARAYTLCVFAALLGSFLIEHVAGRVTLLTVLIALSGLGVAILVARRAEISFVGLVPTSLLALCAWAFASVFWSTDPASSIVSWIGMVMVAAMAVAVGHVRDTLQTVRALGDVARWALGLSLGLEILAGVLLDMPLTFIGIQGNIADLGPIQGIFGTRNALGIIAVIALVTFVVELRTHSVRTGVAVASIVLASTLALLSASPTVFVLAVAVGAATGALAIVRSVPPGRRRALQWTLAAVVIVSAVAAYAQRTTLISFIGATDDLDMRSRLWSMSDYYVRLRPVQGWGWFGLWQRGEQPFTTINLILRESHASALNAFVDMRLQLGWLGLVLFCLLGGIALVRSWLDASQRRSTVYAWTPLLLVALAVTSMFESFVLIGTGWLLLCLAAVRAGQSRSWRHRLERPDSPEPGLQHEPR